MSQTSHHSAAAFPSAETPVADHSMVLTNCASSSRLWPETGARGSPCVGQLGRVGAPGSDVLARPLTILAGGGERLWPSLPDGAVGVFSCCPGPPTSPQGTFPFCEECSQWECCSDVIRTGGEGRPVLLTCRGLRRGALKNQVSARAHTCTHCVTFKTPVFSLFQFKECSTLWLKI